MDHPLRVLHTHAFDFWLARSSILVIIALQLWLGGSVAIGPVWLAPAVEVALLLPLSMATARAQNLAVRATHDEHWRLVARRHRAVRLLAILLTAAVTIINSLSLVRLVHQLLEGHSGATGVNLLVDAVKIWTINVVAFALWYWTLDRGGPANRDLTTRDEIDFLFPQMTMDRFAKGWSPGFVDYLFLAFTNASAFSPTDTLPLSARAKLLMMAQAGLSLLTVAFVAARAVNILA